MHILIFSFAEAAYASNLKRSRIPLLVETNFKPDSWLALMTAGDYHYDFVNKPFESKVQELIQALRRRISSEQADVHVTTSFPVVHGSPDPPIVPKENIQLVNTAPEVLKAPHSRENEYKV